MIGKKFGKLCVLSELDERAKGGGKQYRCKCECGNITIVRSDHLKNGHTTSCGCNKIMITSHRKSNTRMFKIWDKIKQRCYNHNDISYKNYGKRGIKMCDEWRNDFMKFYNWSITHCYNDNLSIDRIDVNGNYEPNNCRWVDNETQQNNKRNTVYITYNGKTQSVSQWCRELKLNLSTVYYRAKRGYTAEYSLFKKGSKYED